MEKIEESDYVLFKALTEIIIKNVSEGLKKLNGKCLTMLAEYKNIKTKLTNCETYDEVNEWSKVLDEKRVSLIKLVAIQDRLEKMLDRNLARNTYFKSKLDSMGIYNDAVDRKILSETLHGEKNNVSEEILNLNPAKNDGITYEFFAGQILAFKNGKPDLSLEYNQNVLNSAPASFYHDLVCTFPSSVGTIPIDGYLILNIKNNILRESVLYVASKMKDQSMQQSNAELGLPLVHVGSMSGIEEYAKELKNYFNVCVKQYLKGNMQKMGQDVESLRCVEWSEFLPASKRIAPLSQGIAGDKPKTEEEESEEVRKEQEKEAQKAMSTNELLDLLLSDDDDLEIQEEQDEQEEHLKDEEIKLNEQKKEEEELEQMKELGLRKHDSEGY